MVKRKCIGFMLAAAIVSGSLMTTTNQVNAYNNGNLDATKAITTQKSVEENVIRNQVSYRVVNTDDKEQMKELEEYIQSRIDRNCIVLELKDSYGSIFAYEIVLSKAPIYENRYNEETQKYETIITGYNEDFERIDLETKPSEQAPNLPMEGTTIGYKEEEVYKKVDGKIVPVNERLYNELKGYMDYLEKDSSKAFPLFEVVQDTRREEGKLITRFTINKIREGKPGSDFYCAIEIERKSIKSNWDNQDGQWHYYDENGNLVKGLAKANWNGVEEKYYFDEEGHMVSNKWVKVDGKWYFCQSGGAVATGWLNEGNVWYYLNVEGVMQTGWQKIHYNGKYQWFFLESHGAMATGWKFIDNKWYYLNADGTMATSKLIDGKVTEDGKEIVVQYKVDAHGVWDGITIYPANN